MGSIDRLLLAVIHFLEIRGWNDDDFVCGFYKIPVRKIVQFIIDNLFEIEITFQKFSKQLIVHLLLPEFFKF